MMAFVGIDGPWIESNGRNLSSRYALFDIDFISTDRFHSPLWFRVFLGRIKRPRLCQISESKEKELQWRRRALALKYHRILKSVDYVDMIEMKDKAGHDNKYKMASRI